MTFATSPQDAERLAQLQAFMAEYIYPQEAAYKKHQRAHPWQVFPLMEELKAAARAAGLWNLFLPKEYSQGAGLSNLSYALLAEEMGKVPWASEVFNCNAPDTGNMEVLAKYGTPEQQAQWLAPLLEGRIRSAFLMTEPDVASSDATNIATAIVRDGDEYVITGRKWWATGALHPHCELAIVMGKTNPDAPAHSQQSMVLVPMRSSGLRIVRPLSAMHHYDGPGGHAEITLDAVRVPASHILLGEGRGFEIAQGRLGPGRIHHCMRMIGQAQRALEYMCRRVNEREAFGQKLSKMNSIRQQVASSASDITQARLLTLAAADKIDREGIKGAKDLIAMIKIVAPRMLCEVADRAMQAFGGMGLSDDTPLADFWTQGRVLRLADGPDEVHLEQLGRNIIAHYAALGHPFTDYTPHE